ncbi:MAG TPA: tetratricopeptide repeat protein [Candidatus Obscuribacterales bacterium]
MKDFVVNQLLCYLALICQFTAVLPGALAGESSSTDVLPEVDLSKPSARARAGDGFVESRRVPLPKAEMIDEADKLLRSGNAEEAENILGVLIREEELVSGKESPELILLLRGMGDACLLQGKLLEAESSLLRAIKLQLAQKKGPNEDLAYDMRLLGQTYLQQGRISDAQAMFALGLGAIDQVYKGDAKPLKLRIELIDLLADTLEREGDWSKAEPLLERLLRLQRQHQQPLKIADKAIADTLKRLEHVKAAQKVSTDAPKPLEPRDSRGSNSTERALESALFAVRQERAFISIQGRALSEQEKGRLEALEKAEALLVRAQQQLSAVHTPGATEPKQ